MLYLIWIAFNAACATMLIHYCIGKPGDDFSPHEIFAFYTAWLSKRRLIKAGVYDNFAGMFPSNENRTRFIKARKEYWEVIQKEAQPYFTWERAAGICPICTGVWITLFVGLAFLENYLHLFIIVIISHVFIRLLNKVI